MALAAMEPHSLAGPAPHDERLQPIERPGRNVCLVEGPCVIAAERLTALQQEDLALRLQHLEPVGDQPVGEPATDEDQRRLGPGGSAGGGGRGQ